MFRDGFGVLGHSGRNIKVGRREARASPSITYQPLGKSRQQVIKKVNALPGKVTSPEDCGMIPVNYLLSSF